MLITDQTTTREIVEHARKVEVAFNARTHLFSDKDALEVLEYAWQARVFSEQVHRKVALIRRKALPTDYGYSGAKFTQWTLDAYPNGEVYVGFCRVPQPANDKSFRGIELDIREVDSRNILWQAGRQRERVLRFDEDIVRVARGMLMTIFLTFFLFI